MIFPQLSDQFQTYASAKVGKKSTSSLDIGELLLIQQQSDLINQLMLKSQSGSKKSYTFSTEISEVSIDSVEKPRNLNTSISAISLCKQYSKYFDEDSTQQMLSEIKNYCSRKTYNFVRNKLRASVDSKLEARLQKEIKYNQQLTQRCFKLSQEVAQLQVRLSAANEKIKAQVIKKSPSYSDMNSSFSKSQVLVKWQKSILYKQKIQAEVKKSLNKQFKILNQQKAQNEVLRKELKQMLQKITSTESNPEQLNSLVRTIYESLNYQIKKQEEHNQDYIRIQQKIEDIVKEMKDLAKGCY